MHKFKMIFDETGGLLRRNRGIVEIEGCREGAKSAVYGEARLWA